MDITPPPQVVEAIGTITVEIRDTEQRMTPHRCRRLPNYIANRCYAEALNVLNGIPFAERSARWYYYSAMANQGAGNNIVAKQHAGRAVEMEPSNLNTVSFYNIWNLEVHGTPAWVIIMTDHIPVPEAGA